MFCASAARHGAAQCRDSLARVTCIPSRHSGMQFNFVLYLFYVARVCCEQYQSMCCSMHFFCTSHLCINGQCMGLHSNIDGVLLSASRMRHVPSSFEATNEHTWNVFEH